MILKIHVRGALLAALMLAGTIETAEDDEESAAASETPACRLGELWLLGSDRVLCGDATSAEAVARLLRGAISDALFGVEE